MTAETEYFRLVPMPADDIYCNTLKSGTYSAIDGKIIGIGRRVDWPVASWFAGVSVVWRSGNARVALVPIKSFSTFHEMPGRITMTKAFEILKNGQHYILEFDFTNRSELDVFGLIKA